ncbi:hypothetical protein BJ508DRAFT_71690 [Ascobolus immersus RN42]|uniref:RING-type domain-containing protein n=1 Tax=Ascobolus immersus RN42 TaxID=1160509 RepID=A0A3N4IFB7_ASCIM|nr:hypothetical protein BJ508DRAFT_71690 [Ascobolus immersus RN42]
MGVAKETRSSKESTPQPPAKKETDPKDDLIQDLQSDLAKLRKCVECVICQELLFEPYWLQCGHIFCYRCLVEWFEQKKSCPECRAKVDIQPTGAFLIRDMVETFIARAEVTAPTSIGEELRKSQKEAHEAVEKDKNCQHGNQAGLFRGIFKQGRRYKIKRGHRDPDDQVLRCPDCFWEVIDGICEACGNPVLDENAPAGDSDNLTDVDMDFSDSGSDNDDDDESTTSEEGDQNHPIDLEAEDQNQRDLRRRARRRARLANSNSIIDLTGTQPPGLEPVDEDSEEELDSEDSLNDFVEHDTPQRPNRRNRRGTSERETPSSFRQSSEQPSSSPVLRHRLADSASEASEDSHNRTFDEEDSSAVSDGSSRVGNRRRGPYNYRNHSLVSDEDDVSLLGGYQQLAEETAQEEDDSDDTEGFSPIEDNVPETSQRPSNPRSLGSDASTNYASAQSRRESTAPADDSSVQSSPPPTRPTARRRGTVRHISRIPDDDEDNEDDWQDSSDDVDNEGDVRMSDNVSVASSRTSSSRARQTRRRPVGRVNRNRNARPTVIPDSDDESTTDASSAPTRRRLPNGVGYFANNSSSAARRAMSGSGDRSRPDPRIQNLFSQMTRTRSSDASNNNPRNGPNNHPLAELGSVSPARSVTPVASTQTLSSTISSPEQPVSRPSNRTRGTNNSIQARNMRAVSIASTQSQASQPNSPRTRGPRSPGSSSPPRTDPNVPPVGLPYSLGILSTLRSQRLGHRSSRNALRASTSRSHMRSGISSPLSPTHTGRGRNAVSVAPQPTFQSTPMNTQRGLSAPPESPVIGNHQTPISESVIHQEGQTLMQQRRMRSLEMQRHAEQQRLRGEEMRRRLQQQQEQEAQQRRAANVVPPQISTTAGLGRRTSRRNLQNQQQQPAHRLTPGSIPETAFPNPRQTGTTGPRTRRAGVFEIGESEDSTRQGGPLWNINTGNNDLH